MYSLVRRSRKPILHIQQCIVLEAGAGRRLGKPRTGWSGIHGTVARTTGQWSGDVVLIGFQWRRSEGRRRWHRRDLICSYLSLLLLYTRNLFIAFIVVVAVLGTRMVLCEQLRGFTWLIWTVALVGISLYIVTVSCLFNCYFSLFNSQLNFNRLNSFDMFWNYSYEPQIDRASVPFRFFFQNRRSIFTVQTVCTLSYLQRRPTYPYLLRASLRTPNPHPEVMQPSIAASFTGNKPNHESNHNPLSLFALVHNRLSHNRTPVSGGAFRSTRVEHTVAKPWP